MSEGGTQHRVQSHHHDSQSLHRDDSHSDKTALETQTTPNHPGSPKPDSRHQTEEIRMMEKDEKEQQDQNHCRGGPPSPEPPPRALALRPTPRADVSNFSVTLSSGTFPDDQTLAKAVTERSQEPHVLKTPVSELAREQHSGSYGHRPRL